jgi:hypothetical protein
MDRAVPPDVTVILTKKALTGRDWALEAVWWPTASNLISKSVPDTMTLSFGFMTNSSPGFTLLENKPQPVSKTMTVESVSNDLIEEFVTGRKQETENRER